MQVLAESDIITRIDCGQTFSAQLDSHAFRLKIDRYVPAISTAMHNGHHVSRSLKDYLLISEAERQFEEDPYTGELIEAQPITIIVHDSRYCYDLNRKPEDSIYTEAWGKKVWKRPLEPAVIDRIKDLHGCYYRILHHLVGQIEKRFSSCVLYDIHSYNYSRLAGNPPLFNIGTHYIDPVRFRPIIDHLQNNLDRIRLPGLENRSVFDEVFQGRGYQAAFTKHYHPNSLCIPLEVKKIFMDEHYFGRKAGIFSELRRQMGQALMENAARFESECAGTK